MAVFKKHLKPLRRNGQIVKHVGKGATEQDTPPGGLNSLTQGDPANRTMQQYGKDTPMMGGFGPDLN